MCRVGGKNFSNLKQIGSLIIREEMSGIYWETDKDPVATCKAFVRKYCNGVLSFV